MSIPQSSVPPKDANFMNISPLQDGESKIIAILDGKAIETGIVPVDRCWIVIRVDGMYIFRPL